MGKKSNKVFIIVLIILSLLIIATSLVMIYLKTDLFKNEEQLFYKYAGQKLEAFDMLEEASIKEYFQKKQTTPHENEGKYTLSIQSNDFSNKEIIDKLDEISISFSGKTDPQNNKIEQNISLNYSDNVNFPIQYVQNKDIIGLISDPVVNKYVGIKNENLKELMQKLGASDTTDIPDKIGEMQEEQKTEEEIKQGEEEAKKIKDTYLNIIKDNINEENYSKIKDGENVGYSLKLTYTEIKNIYIKILEQLKQDEIILSKISNEETEISKEDFQNQVQELIDEAQDYEPEDQQLQINVYKSGEKSSLIEIIFSEFKIDIKMEENIIECKIVGIKDGQETPEKFVLSLNKQQQNNNTLYELKFEALEEEEKLLDISFLANYTGINSENSSEIYSFQISSEELIANYQFENKINFVDNVEIEDLTSENTIILNDYEQQEIYLLLAMVGEKIDEVNKEKLAQAGFSEDDMPILYIIPGGHIFYIYNLASSSLSDAEVDTFNRQFEQYGSLQSGSNVNRLLQRVVENNKLNAENPEKTIDVYSEELEQAPVVKGQGSLIKNTDTILTQKANDNSTYKIDYLYDDETGYITAITIKLEY